MSLNLGNWVIITDLDGTLTDSDARLNAMFRKMMDEFGYGKSVSVVLKGTADDREPKEIMKDANVDNVTRGKMENRLKEMIIKEKFGLRPYAKRSLRILWKKGYKFAIVTHNYYEPVLKFINENGIAHLFKNELIITHDNFPERKPSKKIIDEIMKRSDCDSVIIIGNTDSDIRFAMNRGLPVIFFSGATAKLASSYERVYRCERWNEVPGLIEKIITT